MDPQAANATARPAGMPTARCVPDEFVNNPRGVSARSGGESIRLAGVRAMARGIVLREDFLDHRPATAAVGAGIAERSHIVGRDRPFANGLADVAVVQTFAVTDDHENRATAGSGFRFPPTKWKLAPMILNINVNLSKRLIFSPSAAEVLRRLHPKTLETLYFSMTKLAFAAGRVANLFFDRSAPRAPIREQ